MKKDTIDFIKSLLEREIQAETIQENGEMSSIAYIKDLINATKDFIKQYGDWTDAIYLDELVEELYKSERK